MSGDRRVLRRVTERLGCERSSIRLRQVGLVHAGRIQLFTLRGCARMVRSHVHVMLSVFPWAWIPW